MTGQQGPNTRAALIGDGFCPTCGALDDEACVAPNGSLRQNHKRRHLSVGELPEADRASEHWTRLSEADRP